MDSIMLVVDGFGALFKAFWFLWTPLLFLLLLKVVVKLYRNAHLAKSGITELDQLDGESFEKYLELLFRRLGYSVTRTPYQGDYGADLVIQKAGVQTVVQAKRYNRSVGVQAIQEAVTAKEYYKCAKAMVVTNNYYSQQAKKLAAANQVELWDRDKLVNLLISEKQRSVDATPHTDLSADQAVITSVAANPASIMPMHCETCGKQFHPK